MDRVIEKCPWCGGQLVWSEWTLKQGAEVKATCYNSIFTTRIGFSLLNSYTCDFECSGVRAGMGVIFKCTEEYYWRNRFKEVQLEFDFNG